MSDNIKTDQAGPWVVQLSVKLDGIHLLNLRHETAEGFGALLGWAVENAEQIQMAAAALGGSRKPDLPHDDHFDRTPRPVPAPAPIVTVAAPVAAPAGEIGPVQIVGVEIATTNREGVAMNSAKYTVKFSNGKRLSTFDKLTGDSAQTLSGHHVYYTTVQKGTYVNLASVRRAS